jgi:integrase/recombinase XerC
MITTLWAVAISDYLNSQTAAGYPTTTIKTRREHLQYLARRTPESPWSITADELVNWAAALEWSPSTRRSRRTSLQSFFQWTVASGRRAEDPSSALRKVKQPRPAPRPMPLRIYDEALMRANADERLAMELAWDHGLRRAEIAQVHSNDILEDFVGHSLVVHGKGATDRIVPLTLRMARTLLDRGPGFIFPGRINGHVSPEWLGKRVNALFEGDWTVHKCRHAAGTRWNRKGGLLVAQKLLGHASVATTQVYCAVADEDLRATLLATAS